LKNLIPYLYQPEVRTGVEFGTDVGQSVLEQCPRIELIKSRRVSVRDLRLSTGNRYSVYNLHSDYDTNAVIEERVIYINCLRCAYYRMVESGELEAGFIGHSLFQSLKYAEDAATRGLPLSDWNALEVESWWSWVLLAERVMRLFFNMMKGVNVKHVDFNLDFYVVSLRVRQILALIGAHEWARKTFEREFSKAGEGRLTEVEKIVLSESDNQVKLANEALNKLEAVDVTMVTSHYACQILLNKAAHYLTKLNNYGLMTEREVRGFLNEIDKNLSDLFKYQEVDDQMNDRRKEDVLSSWDLGDAISKKPSINDAANLSSMEAVPGVDEVRD
jgi:hypothetical protein